MAKVKDNDKKIAIFGGGIAGLTAAMELAERGFTNIHLFEAQSTLGGKARSQDVWQSGMVPPQSSSVSSSPSMSTSSSLNGTTSPSSSSASSSPSTTRIGVANSPDLARRRAPEAKQGKEEVSAKGEWTKPLPGEHGFRFYFSWYKNVIDTLSRIPVTCTTEGENEFEIVQLNGKKHTVVDNLVKIDSIKAFQIEYAPFLTPAKISCSIKSIIKAIREFIETFVGMHICLCEQLYYAQRLLVLMCSCESRWTGQYDQFNWWDYCSADQLSVQYQKFLVEGVTDLAAALRAKECSLRSYGKTALRIIEGFASSGFLLRVLNGPTSDAWLHPWVKYLTQLGVKFHLNAPLLSLGYDHAARAITSATVQTAQGNEVINADMFVSCIPVEKLSAILNNGSPQMKQLLQDAPSISHLQDLETRWMCGAQFYLSNKTNMGVYGHVGFWDAPYALTGVSELQFWPGYDIQNRGPGNVKSVLSIILSDFITPGLPSPTQPNPFAAQDAKSKEELQKQVWWQMVKHQGTEFLAPDQSNLIAYHIDDNLQWNENGITGNYAPLFVTTPNSLQNRPHALTEVPNLILGGDYVRTTADVGLMESANESGRRAAIGVLTRCGRTDFPKLFLGNGLPWETLPLRLLDEMLYAVDPTGHPFGWNFPVPRCGGKHGASQPPAPVTTWEQLEDLFVSKAMEAENKTHTQ